MNLVYSMDIDLPGSSVMLELGSRDLELPLPLNGPLSFWRFGHISMEMRGGARAAPLQDLRGFLCGCVVFYIKVLG